MNRTLLSIIAAIVCLDRISKLLVAKFIPLEGGMDVIPGFFRLTHLENPGGAFSLLANEASGWRAPLLIGFSIAALVVVLILLWRNRQINAYTLALALVFAGALGNLWDRLADGQVTDFLDFYLGSHHWYPFNIADSAIVTGAVLLLWSTLISPRHKTAPEKD